jgi:hypothetical protein
MPVTAYSSVKTRNPSPKPVVKLTTKPTMKPPVNPTYKPSFRPESSDTLKSPPPSLSYTIDYTPFPTRYYATIPLHSSAKTSKSSDKSCFSGTETVTLESGGSKVLSNVVLGDMILTSNRAGDLSFSEVRKEM